mgnify:CR=1 FL=1
MGRLGKRQRTYISGASWNWIRTGELKEETEGLSFAAQDQAPRTNAVKENVSFKCRMCGSHDETVQHSFCKVICEMFHILNCGF